MSLLKRGAPNEISGKGVFAKCRDQLGRKRPRQGRMDWPETKHWADDKGFSGGVWSKTDTKKVWEPRHSGRGSNVHHTGEHYDCDMELDPFRGCRVQFGLDHSGEVVCPFSLIHSWEEYSGHWQRACRTVILHFQPVKSAGEYRHNTPQYEDYGKSDT